MTVKASISLTDAQDAYARSLVAEGSFPSLSAVLQRGLDLLRTENEVREAELTALRALIRERRSGDFVGIGEGRTRTARMIAGKKAARALSR